MTRTVPNLPDERLCWLAVRDQVNRKARRRGVLGWLTALFRPRDSWEGNERAEDAADLRRETASGKLHKYAFAVDIVAETLTAAERAHLRATGEVPPHFLAEVERRVAERKKR
ncbi:hypothetical protein [Kitasatospora sp. CB01950]|uniref:hypothetical protein n=1 Tax=Kitasatospora sp. CB01950 TaxID=1703930 RepID=UPI00094066F9|nr:hypothetical protein [Kitasatospora sp. CB01950]OKJ07493.1 hypothetical protein AMK19_21430 [Kitasatospora sp. CB01950]